MEQNMYLSDENQNIWNDVLQTVEKKVNKEIYNSWFSKIQFDGCNNQEKVLHLKGTAVNRHWIKTYYADLISQTFNDLNLPNYRLDWEIVEPEKKDFIKVDEDDFDFLPEKSLQIETSSKKTHFVDIEPIESSLSPKYKFENFVVGECNKFAHAASLGAAEAPGKTYNPFFIYGGVGLGKTHLMHAIGHSIKEKNRHLRVAYVTSEKFMNELINAIRYNKTQTFRDKYRSVDVLLMDDVQFLAGKERTQEEFFHTFNALHNEQKQIVITSDCPPREIPTLEERLHSRFEWGLIADIEPPDLETKVAILKRKADLDGVFLPDDVAFYIAGKIKNNIRELEGSLVRLVAISSLRGLPINKMLAQDAIRNLVDDSQSEKITIERIIKEVSSHFKLSAEELKTKSNSRQIAEPRQIAMYLCKRFTKHSFPEIGREFGGKHHTTVMHSVEKIGQKIKEDRDLHKTLSELIDILCG
jgi:chromosomal replication initiator protein